MKFIQNSILLLLSITLIHACVIEEHYHFNADMTGTYTMSFDYSKLAEDDTTGAMRESMAFFSDSLETAMGNYDGVSNIETKNLEHGFVINYDFDGVDVLNALEAEDNPKAKDAFVLSAKGLKVMPDFNELRESTKKDKGDSEMTEEEMNEMMGTMFQVKTRISFDRDVNVKKMKSFKEVGKNSFEYNSVEEGFDVKPLLDVRFK